MSKLKSRKLNKSKRVNANAAALNGSTNDKHPIFSLDKLQGDYCISLCDQDHKVAFVNRLRILSKLTWQQITNAHKHKTGSETISRTSIKATIPSEITDDVTIIALRYNDKAPMVGYRENRIFHIVWIDQNFTLYNHN